MTFFLYLKQVILKIATVAGLKSHVGQQVVKKPAFGLPAQLEQVCKTLVADEDDTLLIGQDYSVMREAQDKVELLGAESSSL